MLRVLCFFRIPALACLTLMFTGCVAYKYSSTFFVHNASGSTISVRTVSDRDGEEISFNLPPSQKRAVYSETITCPENFTPSNKYTPGQTIPPAGLLPKLELWVDGQQLSPDIRTSENWDYFSSEYIENFTLSVTAEMIEYYSPAE